MSQLSFHAWIQKVFSRGRPTKFYVGICASQALSLVLFWEVFLGPVVGDPEAWHPVSDPETILQVH